MPDNGRIFRLTSRFPSHCSPIPPMLGGDRSTRFRVPGKTHMSQEFASRPLVIAPSILASDFARLGEEVLAVDAAGADWIHLDVMDVYFVPINSCLLDVIKGMREQTM